MADRKASKEKNQQQAVTFLLIRHASNDAVGKWLAGRTAGMHLNEKGKDQVQKLAKLLEHVHIDAIYSSPLERSIETAEPIAKSHELEVIACDDVTELDYGYWTNTAIETLKNDESFQRWNRFRSGTRIPGGESMLDAQARLLSATEKMFRKHSNKTVAIVTHADVIKAGLAYWAGISLDMIERLEVAPASVSVVKLGVDWVKVVAINACTQNEWQ